MRTRSGAAFIFEEKPASTHSAIIDAGILLDCRDETLVGLTILDASQRDEDD